MPTPLRRPSSVASTALLAALVASAPVHAADPAFVAITAAQGQALGVVTQRVASGATAVAAGLPATVSIPNGQVRVIAAPLAGVVESLETAPGLNVRKGQVLARLASPQALELQRDRIQADSQAALASQTLKRDEQLYREGLIAEARLQASRANAAQSAAQAAERRQELALAQHSGGQTLTLVAPIAGSVLEQQASVGQRVEQSAPLYRIARLDPLWVEIQAPLAIAAQARVGTPLVVAGGSARGELIAIGRAVDAASQSVLLRGLVTRGADSLRPGQATAVDLELGQGAAPTAVQVPTSAVLRHDNKPWVFVAARDGQATGYRAIPVTLKGRLGDATLVGGLPPDATVVTAGVAALKASWLGIGKE
ncbi:efflux RND transporter periplasmic adaptor subunit [Zoogloea sp.]|uniref:efflux RND transporter periplasmic adaptor subunit n=1 Tax=Zoogloea sp. TaxID=49181 RepID=UPI0035B20001